MNERLYRIKPLKWKSVGAKGAPKYRATTVVGLFEIRRFDAKTWDLSYYRSPLDFEGRNLTISRTFGECKRRAQRRFEAELSTALMEVKVPQ